MDLLRSVESDVFRAAAARFPDDIIEPYRDIYRLAGFDGLAAFLDHFGGLQVYVPSMRTVLARCIEKDALRFKQENGFLSVNKISKKFGYSQRHMLRILNSWFWDGGFLSSGIIVGQVICNADGVPMVRLAGVVAVDVVSRSLF